jgi:hypothetical protein
MKQDVKDVFIVDDGRIRCDVPLDDVDAFNDDLSVQGAAFCFSLGKEQLVVSE